ncbi:hypothetical protein [Streptomyces sp. NPDC023588]|uniref:hypothetical protein n=1 Tax=Streptomyces sp. NPDC023588 TaxID=3154907 RepID=UPI0033CC451B
MPDPPAALPVVTPLPLPPRGRRRTGMTASAMPLPAPPEGDALFAMPSWEDDIGERVAYWQTRTEDQEHVDGQPADGA